jgi:hypothetical protein
MSEHVRCKHCTRSGLPPVPGQRLGAGELAHPVAHVCMHTLDGDVAKRVRLLGVPCFQGVDRAELEAAADHPAIHEFKRMITEDEALWEL